MNEIDDSRLSPRAYRVYLAIRRLMDADYVFRKSLSAISRYFYTPGSPDARTIAELEEAGLIAVNRDNGSRESIRVLRSWIE